MDFLEYCKTRHTENAFKKQQDALAEMQNALNELGVSTVAVSPYVVKGIAENDEPHCSVAFELVIEDLSLAVLFTSKIYRGVPIEKEGELIDLLNELNRGLFGGSFFFSSDDSSVIYRSALFAAGEFDKQNALYFFADCIACTADFGALLNDYLHGNLSYDECLGFLDGDFIPDDNGSEFN